MNESDYLSTKVKRCEDGLVDLMDHDLAPLSIDPLRLNGFYFPIDTLEKINVLRDEGYVLNTFLDMRELARSVHDRDLIVGRVKRKLLLTLGAFITESFCVKVVNDLRTTDAIAHLRMDNVDLTKDDLKLMDKLEKLNLPAVTAEDVFNIDDFEFIRKPSIRSRYCELLRDLKRKLLMQQRSPVELKEYKSPFRNLQEIKNFILDWRNLKSTDIKTIYKLKSLDISHTTVEDIFAVDDLDFLKRFGVGVNYHCYLKDLKHRILTDPDLTIDLDHIDGVQYAAFMKREIITANLSKGMISTLRKLDKLGFPVHHVADLFKVDESTLSEEGGVGETSIKRLRELKRRIWKDASLSREGGRDICFASIQDDILNIIKHIEQMDDPGHRKIVLSRLRLFCKQKTLSKLGKELDLTESRVSQIFADFVKKSQIFFSHSKDSYRHFLQDKIGLDFKIQLQDVYKYFNGIDFYNLLEILFEFENNELLNAQSCSTREISKYLSRVFCEYPFPLSVAHFKKILTEEQGLSEAVFNHLMKKAVEESLIHIDDGCIDWAIVHPKAAVANVLLSESRGLHWEDIVRLVNKLGITQKPLSSDYDGARRHFRMNDSIVKINFGAFCHCRYHDFSDDIALSLAESVEDYIKNMNENEVSLKNLFDELNLDDQVSYFEFRQTVQEFFPDHFDGSSRRDILRREVCARSILLRDRILDAVISSKGYITVEELYDRKIGAINSIRMCLANLKHEEHIVRVGASSYTTKEKLYEHLDVQAIKSVISEILSSTNRIVEADFIRVNGNRILNESYRKEVYVIVGADLCKEIGYHCVRNMFSKNPILAKSMYDFFKRIYQPGMSSEDLLAETENRILLSDQYKSHTFQLVMFQLSKRTSGQQSQ